MKHLLSVALKCSLLVTLLIALGSGVQAEKLNTKTSCARISALQFDQSSGTSVFRLKQEQAAATPPPPPEPIGPKAEPPREEPPEDGYFYYFDSRPIPLTPIEGQVVVGLADGRESRNEVAIQGIDLVDAERISQDRAGMEQLRLDISELDAGLSSTLEQLRSDPIVRFVSPLFKGPHEDMRLFFADTITAEFRKDVAQETMDKLLGSLNLTKRRQARWDETTWILHVGASELSALDAANNLFESGLVQYAEPNFTLIVSYHCSSNSASADTRSAAELTAASTNQYYEGWHLDTINAHGAQALVDIYGVKTPIIAVVDSGVRRDHPGLENNMYILGYDYEADPPGGVLQGNPDPMCTTNSHGTAVAGVIAAEANGQGAEGVGANHLAIMPVRVGFQSCDGCLTVFPVESLADGIAWAAENNADVINVSLSSLSYSGFHLSQLAQAINAARTEGCPVIAGSGNDDAQGVNAPALLSGAIAVGATEIGDTRWQKDIAGRDPFIVRIVQKLGLRCYPEEKTTGSNYGRTLDIMAPGLSIYSTLIRTSLFNNDCGSPSGTSFAAPQVAAVAAMMKAVNPELTPTQIQDILQRTAAKVGPYGYDQRLNEGGWDPEMGFGRLNAERAVLAALYPPLVRVEAAGITDQAQLVVTWRDDYRHVLYHKAAVSIQGGVSPAIGLSGVGPGCYDFYLKTDHALRRRRTACVESGGLQWIDFADSGTEPLISGDANGDNEINLQDFGIWYDEYHTGCTEACRSDFNGDGEITMSDFAYWYDLYHFGYREGDGWKGSSLPSGFTPSAAASEAMASSATSASIVLQPSEPSLSVGESLILSVYLDTHGAPTDGATVLLHYDPGVFSVQDSDPDEPGTQVEAGTLYTQYQHNKVEADTGLIWVSAYSPGDEPFTGYGEFFTAELLAIGALNQTDITVEYRPGWAVDSHIIQLGADENLLGQANAVSISVTGAPERPLPTVTLMPHSVTNERVVPIYVDADDPYDQVQWVQVFAWHDDQWHYIDADNERMDGWSVEWDATAVEDQIVYLGAYAALPGGEVGWGMTDATALDRTPPAFLLSYFDPPPPSLDEVVQVGVASEDNLAGVELIELYINEASDGSAEGTWVKVGELRGAAGKIAWDTTPFAVGRHQVAFAMKDHAGNWNRWVDTELPTIVYANHYWADVVPDCEVNVLDIQTVAAAWRCASGQECYEPYYDIDDDGAISVVDIMMVAAEWGWSCGDDGDSGGSPAAAVFPSWASMAAEPTLVSVEPGSSIVAPGDIFTVSVAISDVENLGAFQFETHYNPAVVHAVDAVLGPFLGSTGRNVGPVGPTIDNDAGTLSFGAFSFGTQPAPQGSGVLAQLTLAAQRVGTTALGLEDVRILDPAADALPATVVGGTVTVEGQLRLWLPLILRSAPRR